ncbi:MAG: hypothetical protein AB7I36_20970 [Rhodospirillaceae bacterium]
MDRAHWYGQLMNQLQAEEMVRDVDALKANGFLVDEAPDAVLKEVSAEFSAFLEGALSDPERRAKLIPALAQDESFYSIHPAKIDHHLQKRLRGIGLIHERQGDDYSDIELEPVTAAFYMLHLANKMAGRRALVTDEARYQSLMYQPIDGAPSRKGAKDQELRLATAVFETVIPTGLNNVPIDTLMKIQYDLADQRRRFQDKIRGVAKSMEKIDHPEDMQEEIDVQVRKLEDDQEDLRERLKAVGATGVGALMAVSVPSWVPADWGAGAKVGSVLLIGAGAIAVSNSLIKSIFEYRAAKRTNPMTYVLSVKKRVNASAEAQRITSLNLSSVRIANGGHARIRRRMARAR